MTKFNNMVPFRNLENYYVYVKIVGTKVTILVLFVEDIHLAIKWCDLSCGGQRMVFFILLR